MRILSLSATLLCLSSAAYAANFTVTQAADSNDACDSACSLREAITAANNSAGADTIAFAIPGTGPFVLGLSSGLPAINETLSIDGYTQAGSQANTAALGSNAVLQIELRGGGAVGIGLALCAANIVVRGLAITGFGAAGLHTATSGPLSCLTSGSNVRVEGNFIGLQADGSNARPNGHGIVINSAVTHIGGNTLAQRNVIAGNSANGILIEGSNLAGSSVLGNAIGTDRGGVLDRGNAGAGIRVDAAQDIVIGTLAAPNTLAFNQVGVNIGTGSQRIDAAHNVIRLSDALGIDLSAFGPNGVTPNDVDDVDFGSNALQNFPELTSVERTASGLRLQGFLDVLAATQNVPYRLNFYASTNCDANGIGEAERMLGTITQNFSQGSAESFEILIDTSPLAIGSFISSTATGPSGTSEFSACIRLDGLIFRNGFD